ncbi:MAG: Rho termination factor N-terminal domain-containing protein [Cellulomonas sp.]
MPGRLRDPSPSSLGRLVGASPPRDEPSGPYEDWTLAELRRRAAVCGIAGRSRMRKDDLVRALRSSSGGAR